jgi:hypothetical protein
VNCENRPTPKRSTASEMTALGGGFKDDGVDARPITTPLRLARSLRTNNVVVQRINNDGGSLNDHAAALSPSLSFNRYQFRGSSRPVSAVGCRVVDLGVQVFAELANAYVNRRFRQGVTSGKDGFLMLPARAPSSRGKS